VLVIFKKKLFNFFINFGFFFSFIKKKKKKILDPLKPKSWLRHCRYHLLFGQESFTMQQEKVTGIACSGSARLS
jgi:hypothetical protein